MTPCLFTFALFLCIVVFSASALQYGQGSVARRTAITCSSAGTLHLTALEDTTTVAVVSQHNPKPAWSRTPLKPLGPLWEHKKNVSSILQATSINGASSGTGMGNSQKVFMLRSPKLLLRFRYPRVVSEEKLKLISLQDEFAALAAQERESRGERDDYYPSSSPSSYSSYSDSRGNVGGASKKVGSKRLSKEEEERRNKPGGGRKVGVGSVASARSRDMEGGDEQDEDAERDDDADVQLSDVPSTVFAGWVGEGLGVEQMQQRLFLEWGIRANARDLRRRALPASTRKKRTGKSRRERVKARKAQVGGGVGGGLIIPQEPQSLAQLAGLLQVPPAELIRFFLLSEGSLLALHQTVQRSAALRAARAFGQRVIGEEVEEDGAEDYDEEEDYEDVDGDEESALPRLSRAPVVAVMGHVDHGKTSLLDRVRNTRVAQGEAGGITQGISAFQVPTAQGKIVTFIDTPGHAAFSQMRQRGATATDIVLLVVAADDGVMEQTRECIVAAARARCPIVVAINKVDKADVDVARVKQELATAGVLLEELGGDVQCALVSAKNGLGLDDLLDKVLLQAEVMQLRAVGDGGPFRGSVLESRVVKGRGAVANVLVQQGALRPGEFVVAGGAYGKVRSLLDDRGLSLKLATPSMPVQVVGLNAPPEAGDFMVVAKSEAEAKGLAQLALDRQRAGSGQGAAALSLSSASQLSGEQQSMLKLPLVLKADCGGSVEAVAAFLRNTSHADQSSLCRPDLVFQGVGEVTTSDVAIAAAAHAKILAFRAQVSGTVRDEAASQNVQLHSFDVLYDLMDFVADDLSALLSPPLQGTRLGLAMVKKVFKLGKAGRVAGCEVLEGCMRSTARMRVLRDREVVFDGHVGGLKLLKDDVQEVAAGKECGVSILDFENVQEGDTLECYVV